MPNKSGHEKTGVNFHAGHFYVLINMYSVV